MMKKSWGCRSGKISQNWDGGDLKPIDFNEFNLAPAAVPPAAVPGPPLI
jgi:hypothetical protein